MKKLFFVFIMIGAVCTSFANHTKGGWLYYEYLGPGAAPNTARYAVTLKIYTECFLNTNQWCSNVNISIFNGGSNTLVEVVNVQYRDSVNIQNCTRQVCHPCISSIPNICYKIATFTFVKDLPITAEGYVLSYQRCCRIANIINLAPGSSSVGDTWTVSIPGTNNADPTAYKNSSAKFAQNDTAIICKDNFFTFDFSAIDADDDSLVYSFTDAYYSRQSNNAGQCGSLSESPPFQYVSYSSAFSGSQPMGSGVTINPVTGIVSGIAPTMEGTYVLTCTVSEFKRGTSIVRATVQKSLHISVTDCSLTQARLDPEYFSCESFTRSFVNNATGGNIQTYFWDFGVPGMTNDTSTLPNPTFTYPDTGSYVLKLVVNKNLPCSDSALSRVNVYPVFATDFSVQGQCKNTPITFRDLSTTTYGVVDTWLWNFGDPGSPINTATVSRTQHVYATEASYNVTLIAANSKGCRDTLSKAVVITDKPALDITNDTLICVIDTLRLNSAGTGTFTWTPGYNINSLTGPSPLVSPDVPTRYYVTLTDPYGCVGRDSVMVNVKQFVTLRAAADTTICSTDPITLGLNSDALSYVWTESPSSASMNDPTLKNPVATPLSTTVFHVVGNIGKCTASDDINVKVVPYPNANAGADTTVCFGTSAQLQATGGSSYTWNPTTFLTNPRIANPFAITPLTSLTYIVTVTDNLGCPKPAKDSIHVSVSQIFADAGPRDTSVVLDQPLQLTATGSSNYLWTPAQWLSSVNIASPMALPQNDIVYTVKVSNAAGCFDVDSIRVKVFKLDAGFYVPSAFSPNGDGKNEYFRPIAIGMRSIDAFRVYNRWGQLLYNDTSTESGGWDGSFAGRPQDPATYVWYAEGTDFRNTKIKKRGYVVLIR